MVDNINFLATLSRHFNLGESPTEVAMRPWWDCLAMSIAIAEERKAAPADG